MHLVGIGAVVWSQHVGKQGNHYKKRDQAETQNAPETLAEFLERELS